MDSNLFYMMFTRKEILSIITVTAAVRSILDTSLEIYNSFRLTQNWPPLRAHGVIFSFEEPIHVYPCR